MQIEGLAHKRINHRYSLQILDYLGLIGGFASIIFMFFSPFGAYFSSAYARAMIASKLFLQRDKGEYSKIEYTLTQTIIDPIIYFVLKPF
jgi:hypothetical protein